ncbi:LOW QUALITY PROTEIN: CCN family member 5 [Neosynchiropus ocellatus]
MTLLAATRPKARACWNVLVNVNLDCKTLVCLFQVFCQLCDRTCLCPSPAPQCAPGVAVVSDGCRCCQVCARQLGESCTEMSPCDHRKGLKCDYSAAFPGEPGECVQEEAMSCELNGLVYQDGESFQPSCDRYCRCRGGGITCVPACPLNIRFPTPDCPHPRHVRLPGKCCREWVCEDLANTVIQDAIAASGRNAPFPSISRSVPSNSLAVPASKCVAQSTQWSACSQSCGAGVSTRVSNQNPACKLQMETRLCKVRPCQPTPAAQRHPAWGQQGHCKASYTSPGPIRLVHQGCYSVQAYQLRYCGHCTDARCCTPHWTTTAQVTFKCPSGTLLKRAVMMIHSCVCHNNCPYAPYRNPAFHGLRP